MLHQLLIEKPVGLRHSFFGIFVDERYAGEILGLYYMVVVDGGGVLRMRVLVAGDEFEGWRNGSEWIGRPFPKGPPNHSGTGTAPQGGFRKVAGSSPVVGRTLFTFSA